MSRPAKWKDLLEFIQEKIEKEGESFLEKKIFIECQDPNNINPSFKTVTDSEGTIYTEPAWVTRPNTDKKWVNSCFFTEEEIVTLNINY